MTTGGTGRVRLLGWFDSELTAGTPAKRFVLSGCVVGHDGGLDGDRFQHQGWLEHASGSCSGGWTLLETSLSDVGWWYQSVVDVAYETGGVPLSPVVAAYQNNNHQNNILDRY